MTKTIQQIKYEVDDLLKEKENLIGKQIENKVDEIIRIFDEIPPQNNADMKRVLMMMASDIKHIVRQ
jgi:uncharacterized protein YoxC